MKLDENIFEFVYGRRPFISRDAKAEPSKDFNATISLHYILWSFGVHDLDPTGFKRNYPDFFAGAKGVMFNMECFFDIDSDDGSDYAEPFSKKTVVILSSVKDALLKTREEVAEDFDSVEAIIGGAVCLFNKVTYFYDTAETEKQEKLFKKVAPNSNFDLSYRLAKNICISYNKLCENGDEINMTVDGKIIKK